MSPSLSRNLRLSSPARRSLSSLISPQLVSSIFIFTSTASKAWRVVVYRFWPEHVELEKIKEGDQRLVAAALVWDKTWRVTPAWHFR